MRLPRLLRRNPLITINDGHAIRWDQITSVKPYIGLHFSEDEPRRSVVTARGEEYLSSRNSADIINDIKEACRR